MSVSLRVSHPISFHFFQPSPHLTLHHELPDCWLTATTIVAIEIVIAAIANITVLHRIHNVSTSELYVLSVSRLGSFCHRHTFTHAHTIHDAITFTQQTHSHTQCVQCTVQQSRTNEHLCCAYIRFRKLNMPQNVHSTTHSNYPILATMPYTLARNSIHTPNTRLQHVLHNDGMGPMPRIVEMKWHDIRAKTQLKRVSTAHAHAPTKQFIDHWQIYQLLLNKLNTVVLLSVALKTIVNETDMFRFISTSAHHSMHNAKMVDGCVGCRASLWMVSSPCVAWASHRKEYRFGWKPLNTPNLQYGRCCKSTQLTNDPCMLSINKTK